MGQAGAGSPAGVFDLLTALVERSFVIREGTSGRARYRLHETMREFALLRLREADEEAAARSAHLTFYVAPLPFHGSRHRQGEDAASKLARLDELDLEADNVRAALRHCLADPDGADLGLAMAAGLGQYWRSRAVSEGAHWIDALLARRGGDDAIRGEALFTRSTLRWSRVTMRQAWRRPRRLARSHAATRPTTCLSGSSRTRPRCRSLRATCRQLARPSAEATALAARLGDDMSFIAAAQSDAFIAFLDGDFVRMREVGLAAARRCRREQ